MESILLTAAQTFGVLATVLYVIGIILLLIEVFVPGFGIFGISGLTALAISVVTKIILGESLAHILWSIVIAFIVIIALLVWMIISARKGILSKSPLISSGTSIPTFYNDENLKVYIDKEGETVTLCRPIGKIRIDNEIYEATSLDGYLEIGTKIVVTGVKDNTLQISKIKEEI